MNLNPTSVAPIDRLKLECVDLNPGVSAQFIAGCQFFCVCSCDEE